MDRVWRAGYVAAGGVLLLAAFPVAHYTDWECGRLVLGRWSVLHTLGLGGLLAVGLALAAMGLWLPVDRLRGLGTRLVTAAFSAGLTLVMLEAAMRLTEPPRVYSQPFYQNHEVLGHFTVPNASHRFLASDLRYHRFTTDSNGIIVRGGRNTPDPNARRILFLGDSFVEGTQVGPRENMSELVEKNLARATRDKYQSINLGISAFGPVQYYLSYQTFADDIRPDAVVVVVYVGNDFKNTTNLFVNDHVQTNANGAPVSISPRVEQGQALVDMEHPPADEQTLHATIIERDTWKRGFVRTLYAEVYRPYCNTVNRARQREEIAAEYAAFRRTADNDQPWEGLREYTAEEQADWPLTADMLSLLADAVQADGAELVMVIVPTFRQVPGQAVGLRIDEEIPAQVVAESDAPQRFLLNFCVERDLLCIDMLPVFVEHKEEEIYLYHDTHLTQHGHRLMADAITSALLRTGLPGGE